MAKKINTTSELTTTTTTELTTTTTTTQKQLTIFDKYRKYINSVKAGYLNGLSYDDAMIILRYIEKTRNVKMPLNMSCASCIFELVRTFASLEK